MNPQHHDSTLETFKFGPFPIEHECIFYSSKHCIAITNLSCVFPGHVLIIPKKCELTFCDYPDKVLRDYANTVQYVIKMLKAFYDVTVVNICFQNGASAGMTVPHQHIHLCPIVKDQYDSPLEFLNDVEREQVHENVTLKAYIREREMLRYEAAIYREFIANGFKHPSEIKPYLIRTDQDSAKKY